MKKRAVQKISILFSGKKRKVPKTQKPLRTSPSLQMCAFLKLLLGIGPHDLISCFWWF